MKSKLLLVGFIIFLVLAGYRCGKEVIVADELIGVWKTSEPKYKECYFELTKDEYAICDIEGDISFFKIIKVKAEEDLNEGFISYVITYVDLEGRSYEFPILYFPGDKATIRFKNQPNIVWTKSGTE